MFVGRAESGTAASTSSRPQTASLNKITYRHRKYRTGCQSSTSQRAAPPCRMVSMLQRTISVTNETIQYPLCACLSSISLFVRLAH